MRSEATSPASSKPPIAAKGETTPTGIGAAHGENLIFTDLVF